MAQWILGDHSPGAETADRCDARLQFPQCPQCPRFFPGYLEMAAILRAEVSLVSLGLDFQSLQVSVLGSCFLVSTSQRTVSSQKTVLLGSEGQCGAADKVSKHPISTVCVCRGGWW